MLYAVDLAVMFLILGFFNYSLANEEKNLVPKNYLKKFRFDRNYDIVVAAIFIVSTVPIFEYNVQVAGHGIPLRVFLWIAALIFGLIRRLVFSLKKED